jgi:natural product biosynthesis luciferase-like monooxygenase protein
MELGLFYFAADAGTLRSDAYTLLIEGAKLADRAGFSAVWTPERHFHPFGGAYPNPSVTGAAVAAVTRDVAVRAGSVVLPLHDPLRIVEEWSVVDNLSGGRAGVAFASGWHASDFALAPQAYADRREGFAHRLDQVRRLWRGEELDRVDGMGGAVRLAAFPRPVQPELPVWITSSGSMATFRLAGQVRANLLTHLLGQDLTQLEIKIAEYRAERGSGGHVTLMLHTFVGHDDEDVRELVRAPMCAYLKSHLDLVSGLVTKLGDGDLNLAELAESDVDFLVEQAFNRYFVNSGLFGSVDTCLAMVDKLERIGVDEIACLVDFGVDTANTLQGLKQLAQLRTQLA